LALLVLKPERAPWDEAGSGDRSEDRFNRQ